MHLRYARICFYSSKGYLKCYVMLMSATPSSTANIKAVRESLWSISVDKLSPIPKLQSVSAVYKNQLCQIWFSVLIELSALELPHPLFHYRSDY